MAYNNNIPKATDQPNNSQPQILTNFATIDTDFAVNHVQMNLTGEGKHKFLQMPNQGADVASAIAEMSLYTKNIGTGLSGLFLRQESNGTVIPMTPSSSFAYPGWARLPGGLLLKWGQTANLPHNTSTLTNFPAGATIPVFAAAPFAIFLTIASSTPTDTVTLDSSVAPTITGFNAIAASTTGATVAQYLAIGH